MDRNGLGLEIGPCHNPLAPKKEGFAVEIMDHTSKEGLLKKYRTHKLPFEKIEEVDYIWERGKTYSEITGKTNHYDWIIASHVIEHVPNLIGFLLDCDRVLKQDGKLSLAIPDKRFIFDYFRPPSSLAQVIDAHDRNQTTATIGTIVDQYLNNSHLNKCATWNAGALGRIRLEKDSATALQYMVDNETKLEYIDAHNWCFTPAYFRLLIHDLYLLGLSPFQEAAFHDTSGCEFFITLSREGKGIPTSRLAMLKLAIKEQKQRNNPFLHPIKAAKFYGKFIIQTLRK